MRRNCTFSKKPPRKSHCTFVILSSAIFLALFNVDGFAQEQGCSPEFERYAMQLRESAILRITPHMIMSPSAGRSYANDFRSVRLPYFFAGRGGWKANITTTVFWVGEPAAINNPVANDKSAWDGGWLSSYGGYDNPNPGARVNFVPLSFLPRQNPFYVALPYNDVDNHHTKPEAAQVIPWFSGTFVRDGQSVCKGRWLAIRHNNRVCYAQWEDVGPFATDHWQYVFGNERPRPNRNQDAGLDVSPAVRDYLGLAGLDACDWKFVDSRSVPAGPWTRYGDHNTFVRLRRQLTSIATQNTPSSGATIPR
ncbi:MAG TPA: hypothetical protein VHS80_11870 [Chthoniobacterales bacterium]|nr:hypothetical protein [Chthoniobacterales bacterium]